MGADRDKSPAEIQREARRQLAELQAEKRAAEILRRAQEAEDGRDES